MNWNPVAQDPPANGASAAFHDDRAGPDATPAANILVVDDQPDKLLVYHTVLAELGENVVTATSGAEALRLMLHMEFAVVLLDVNMPVMDGFETAALIRGRKKLAHTPIIFVTAFGDEMHAAQGYSLGAVDYILAPVVPDILRTKVRVFVQLHRMAVQARRQAEDRIQLAKEQAARSAAEQAIRRADFLAEASRELSRSLDVNTAAGRLARFVVPFMADLCALILADDHGTAESVNLAWMPAPARAGSVQTACGTQLLGEGIQRAVSAILGGRHSASLGSADLEPTLRIAGGELGSDGVDTGLPLAHAALYPMQARGRIIGVLLLGVAAGRVINASENALASELAGRVAIALDNARLYCKILEADRRKDEFLAMLAHELRNPLAPIRNAVEIMRLRSLPQAAADPLCEVIGKEVAHMSRLVDDLLDVSRINRGKITLKLSATDLTAITALALESKRTELEARKQRLHLDLPPTPVWMQGDPVRLNQVLVNLIDNAMKFTPDGGNIWVSLRTLETECELRVRDDGAGMAREFLPQIFHLFVQGERSLDRRLGGLGIGLSLVRDLVELHGGTVAAHSDGAGKGSEFVVRLPRLTCEPVVQEPAPAAPAAGQQQRILVVDDHVDAVKSLAMLLRIHGHSVETAHNAADALQLAPRFKPRLAILDIGLPGMDGYQLAESLLRMPEMRDATLVAMTGYGQAEDQRRSAAAGFHHHLVKPVEPAALLAIINSLGVAAAGNA